MGIDISRSPFVIYNIDEVFLCCRGQRAAFDSYPKHSVPTFIYINFSNFSHIVVEFIGKICYNVYVYTKNTKGNQNDEI